MQVLGNKLLRDRHIRHEKVISASHVIQQQLCSLIKRNNFIYSLYSIFFSLSTLPLKRWALSQPFFIFHNTENKISFNFIIQFRAFPIQCLYPQDVLISAKWVWHTKKLQGTIDIEYGIVTHHHQNKIKNRVKRAIFLFIVWKYFNFNAKTPERHPTNKLIHDRILG